MEQQQQYKPLFTKRKWPPRIVTPYDLGRMEDIADAIPLDGKPIKQQQQPDEYAEMKKSCPTHKGISCPGGLLCECQCAYCKIIIISSQLDAYKDKKRRIHGQSKKAKAKPKTLPPKKRAVTVTAPVKPPTTLMDLWLKASLHK